MEYKREIYCPICLEVYFEDFEKCPFCKDKKIDTTKKLTQKEFVELCYNIGKLEVYKIYGYTLSEIEGKFINEKNYDDSLAYWNQVVDEKQVINNIIDTSENITNQSVS
jgi:hypothetical protein